MPQSLQGKVAFVTGAGRGIGRAVAEALAKEGVTVGLLARTEAQVKEVTEAIKATGGKATFATADVTNMEEVNSAIASLTSEIGPADILINNAGIGGFGKLVEQDPTTWKKIVDTSVFGTYHVTHAVLPQMIEKNEGDIINISSTNGLNGAATSTAYSAAKFGIIGLTESLAQEVRRHNIRVTSLAPSTVVTELAKDSGLVDEAKADRMMQPEDLAEVIVNQLTLPNRIYVKQATILGTNPY
ncbi:3-ketoacyl-ACP reductase [Kurthia sibirica]|uniref:3-ketoacyl-ACP reductase n=1 Tax=Kurthia sibirica TaxID=202750 RepID=A0A2U3ANK4_9BACL|nr:3-ketoacyl-ACP reductase [Kurthia sibirica]PWI26112.1 3-ketoacyl-ACP reductase [Kurthia sibirica]GEK33367.1 3-ketoacyl-ACP reductase [Kurthia sibirica]